MNQAGLQNTSHPRLPELPQACSLRRRDSRVHSELSVSHMKDSHAPAEDMRWARPRDGLAGLPGHRPWSLILHDRLVSSSKRLRARGSIWHDLRSPSQISSVRTRPPWHASTTPQARQTTSGAQALKDKGGRSRQTAREVTVDCEGAVSNLHLNQPMTNHQHAATRTGGGMDAQDPTG